MTPMHHHSDLVYYRDVEGKGRGVFARRPIPKGAVVEQVPLMLVPISYIVDGLDNPRLNRIFFLHDDENLAVCLGYGELYNHSYTPNARYDDGPELTKIFTALRDIAQDEEITINYNWDPEDRTSVGFDLVP